MQIFPDAQLTLSTHGDERDHLSTQKSLSHLRHQKLSSDTQDNFFHQKEDDFQSKQPPISRKTHKFFVLLFIFGSILLTIGSIFQFTQKPDLVHLSMIILGALMVTPYVYFLLWTFFDVASAAKKSKDDEEQFTEEYTVDSMMQNQVEIQNQQNFNIQWHNQLN